MSILSFQQAYDLWSGRDLLDEADIHLDIAEEAILKNPPASPREAVAIADVLLENLETGLRSDGLDLAALRQIRGWLASLPA